MKQKEYYVYGSQIVYVMTRVSADSPEEAKEKASKLDQYFWDQIDVDGEILIDDNVEETE